MIRCRPSNYKWQFHIFLLTHPVALRGIWLNGANFWMEKINTNCKLLARKFKIKLVRYQITTELPPLILSCLLDPQVCCLSVFFWFCGARRLATFVSHLLWDHTDSCNGQMVPGLNIRSKITGLNSEGSVRFIPGQEDTWVLHLHLYSQKYNWVQEEQSGEGVTFDRLVSLELKCTPALDESWIMTLLSVHH